MRFFSPCPPGAERILADELRRLGVGSVSTASRGVGFEGDLASSYEASLALRTASRLLLELFSGDVADGDALYALVSDYPWEEHFDVSSSISCRMTGVPRTHDPRYLTLRLKDGIVDRFSQRKAQRPSVDRRNADLRIEGRWDGRRATIFLNWSGPPLHERGYRLERNEASLRETTAAALLVAAGWPGIAENGGAFVDPVCGSGTLLAEAGMMAAGCPPGVHRKHWGFTRWDRHDEELWRNILNRATVRFGRGLEQMPVLMGFDVDPQALKAARNNLRRAGLGHSVRLEKHDINAGRPELWPLSSTGLVFADPPYGHRMTDESHSVYPALGSVFRSLDRGWRLALLAPDRKTASGSYLKAERYFSTVSGGMDLVLAIYDRRGGVRDEKIVGKPTSDTLGKRKPTQEIDTQKIDTKAPALKKALTRNLAALNTWAKKTGVTSFRIWDSDMPEFNAAVDWYEGRWLHVQEFAAPAKVPVEKSRGRLDTLIGVLQETTGCAEENIYVKTHRRGVRPYHRRSRGAEKFIIRENGARFFVNLVDYLDTGVFLDHRPIRALIRETVGDGHFLNLFSYTGTASVMAALGGASSTVSVDVSNTYLEWSRDNMKLNNIDGDRHLYHRSDALRWLREHGDQFDLIFIDPPTYSNGAGREDWSVQEHHEPLLRLAMEHLRPGGRILFSENFRSFELDRSLKKEFSVEEITRETFHPDFARRARAHRCWVFSAC